MGPDDQSPKTRFFRDARISIITYNDSPDVGFEAIINPYRGCEHGCKCYCIIPTINFVMTSARRSLLRRP